MGKQNSLTESAAVPRVSEGAGASAPALGPAGPKFVFAWAGNDGPCARFFDDLSNLFCYASGWCWDGDVVSIERLSNGGFCMRAA